MAQNVHMTCPSFNLLSISINKSPHTHIHITHCTTSSNMAKPNSCLILYNYHYLLCLFLFFTSACSARQLPRQQSDSFNECQLDSIDALEPDNRIESEAGLTETWDAANHPELRCAGVSVLKRTINPNGLHLPSYVTYPELHFVEQGQVLILTCCIFECNQMCQYCVVVWVFDINTYQMDIEHTFIQTF